MSAAQILQQQQSAVDIRLMHMRNVSVQGFEQRSDFQVRTNVFLTGRRVHDDERVLSAESAEITAEASIRGSGLNALDWELEILSEPILNQRKSRVGGGHSVSGVLPK